MRITLATLLLVSAALGSFAACAADAAVQPASDAAGVAVPAPAVPVGNPADLAAVSGKLNEITTLKANFSQTDAKGAASGRFYLSRPGGVRFEYDPPRKLLIVANDRTVAMQDRKGTTPYRARVDETPLRLLLQPNVDLSRDATISDVHRDGGLLYVTAVQAKGYGQGQVTFMFAEPSLRLERWVATDPTGAQTVVTLNDVEEGAALDKSLFVLPVGDNPNGFGPAR
jgi:outer membrane lipoprotein-sorting protein